MACNENWNRFNKVGTRRVSIRERIIICEDAENNVSEHTLALDHRLAVSTIKTYIRNKKKNGHVLTPYEVKKLQSKTGKVERKKILHEPNHSRFLMELNSRIPSLPLPKYGEWFMGEYGIYICPQTIANYFSYHKMTWKKLSPIAREADETEQVMFWRMIKTLLLSPLMLAYCDEAGRTDKEANQYYGRGEGRVYGEICFSRGGYKMSFIVLTWVRGVLTYEIQFGAFTEATFVKFMVQKAAKYLQRYPYERSMFIIDNCKIHKTQVLIDLADDIGFVLCWLARYTPKDNLAEITICDVKNLEKAKGITGELESLLSLSHSLDSLKYRDYSKELRDIGYIQ